MNIIEFVLNNLGANRFLIVGLLAFYVLAFLMARRASRRGEDADRIWSVAIWMGLGAILGGYIGFLAINIATFVRDPSLLLGNFGQTFYGVFLGGFVGAWFGARRAKLSVRHIAILAAPFLPLAIALDRLGCVISVNACLGNVMPAPFGVQFPGNDVARFPSHIVEGVLTLLVFVAVLLIERFRHRMDVKPFVFGVAAYGVIRSGIDFTLLPINEGWKQIDIALGFLIAFFAAGYLIMQALETRLEETSSPSHVREHHPIQAHRARAPRRRRGESRPEEESHVAGQAAPAAAVEHKKTV